MYVTYFTNKNQQITRQLTFNYFKIKLICNYLFLSDFLMYCSAKLTLMKLWKEMCWKMFWWQPQQQLRQLQIPDWELSSSTIHRDWRMTDPCWSLQPRARSGVCWRYPCWPWASWRPSRWSSCSLCRFRGQIWGSCPQTQIHFHTLGDWAKPNSERVNE